ncbi:MAG: lipopolysaccharide ABC transporter substrate-binding protein LptA [Candidatus Malihini olakiniferum]
MKFNTNNAWRHAVSASVLLAASLPALAATGDTSQPIYINSSQQSLDMQGDTVTFASNVVVKQGTIEIKAERVVVTRQQSSQRQEFIEAFGNPVTFYQVQDNGKPVKGHAQEVRYELAQDKVILTGNAYLEHFDKNVKGDHITYLVKQQQIEAFSDKGRRVTTVLVPVSVAGKNSKTAAPSSPKVKPQQQVTE